MYSIYNNYDIYIANLAKLTKCDDEMHAVNHFKR